MTPEAQAALAIVRDALEFQCDEHATLHPTEPALDALDVLARELKRLDFVARDEEMEARYAARAEAERDAERARADRLAGALAAYRSALRSGEPETERLRQVGDAALAEHGAAE